MKILHLLLLPVFASWPAAAHAKTRAHSAGSGQALPPKWSSLIQPVKSAPDTNLRSGLISTELGGREVDFFHAAVESGRVQLWLCEKAKEHGENERVRAAGDALEGTQSKENTYLARLAAAKGLTLDAPGTPLPQRKIADEIGSLKGQKFDAAIMDQIVATAQATVNSYESGAQSSDAEIKSLSERLLPIAKDKLMLATSIASHNGDPAAVIPVKFRGSPAARGASEAPASAPAQTPAPAAPPARSGSTAPIVKAESNSTAARVPTRPEGPKPIIPAPALLAAPAAIAAPPAGAAIPAAAASAQVAPAPVLKAAGTPATLKAK